jgi:maleylacetoacetate isomerase
MFKLYGSWRSLAAYRVRVALNLKLLAYEEVMLDLTAGDQVTESFKTLNPQAAVPVLVADDGAPITQSLAILEFLDEVYPEPRLLPSNPRDRARVRSLALLFVADHHPLITPRVSQHLVDEFAATDKAKAAWTRYWLRQSLEQAERRLAAEAATGRFCHGDTLGVADICLTSQLLGARALAADTSGVPTVNRIGDVCFALDAFARAHPLVQPGAPRLNCSGTTPQ